MQGQYTHPADYYGYAEPSSWHQRGYRDSQYHGVNSQNMPQNYWASQQYGRGSDQAHPSEFRPWNAYTDSRVDAHASGVRRPQRQTAEAFQQRSAHQSHRNNTSARSNRVTPSRQAFVMLVSVIIASLKVSIAYISSSFASCNLAHDQVLFYSAYFCHRLVFASCCCSPLRIYKMLHCSITQCSSLIGNMIRAM